MTENTMTGSAMTSSAFTVDAESHPRALGVLIVGAGDLGSRHAEHWRAAGARVIGVCDPLIDRAEAVARLVGGECMIDAEAAFTREDVDVVSICVPTSLHPHYVVAALAAGKHVLCEKPVALTLEDAALMKAALEGSGKELRIGLMRRFDPAFLKLKEFHDRIGAPTLAQASIVAGVRPKLMMHEALGNGGPVIDMCCHVFDMWRALFGGPPTRVTAHGYTFGADKLELASVKQKAVDSVLCTLEYPGGTVAQLQVSWGVPSGVEFLERHTYVAPGGLIVLNWNDSVELHAGGEVERWQAPEADAWREQITQYHRELTSGAPCEVATLEEGVEALQVSLAILRSVEVGEPVYLEQVRGAAAQAPPRVA